MNACVDCGKENYFRGSSRCRACYDRRRRHGRRAVCTRCGKPRPVYDPAGRCDQCVYLCRPRPERQVPPCARCGEHRRLVAHQMCNRCLQKDPATTDTFAHGLARRLGSDRPSWFGGFAAHVSQRYSPSEARLRMRELAQLLALGHKLPADLVGAATGARGGLMPLGRALEEFFDAHGLARALGDTAARAAHRRERVIASVPERLRPAVTAFSGAELANRERARRVGALARSDQTLLIHLEVIADFAQKSPAIGDWATVSPADIEAFLAASSPTANYLLPSLRAFFTWARQQRRILVNPTARLTNHLQRRFSGPVVDLGSQRQLFGRWAGGGAACPNEALVGLLCLLHATSVDELRRLKLDDLGERDHTVALAGRPHRVPLDPVTWAAMKAVLARRKAIGTLNPHVLVNRRTAVCGQAVGRAYCCDVLKPAGAAPQRLRCTRLAQLVTTTDPVLVSELFGVSFEGVLYYLADSVDEARLANL